jgi:hypothetical protein
MIFWQLLRSDLTILSNKIFEKIIDLSVWSASVIVVSGYVMPAFGVPANFGTFQAAGLLVACISFELYGNMFELISDIQSVGYIKYLLSLPHSNLKIISTKVLTYTIHGVISALVVIPIIKAILWGQFALLEINYFKLLLAIVLTSLFFGWFTIFLVQRIKSVDEIRGVQVRLIFPLWFFGCYTFSFKIAYYSVSKILGVLCLLSPFTFATEATRSAILGAQNYMPFWLSMGVLFCLTLVAAVVGYRGLKQRLDFV